MGDTNLSELIERLQLANQTLKDLQEKLKLDKQEENLKRKIQEMKEYGKELSQEELEELEKLEELKELQNKKLLEKIQKQKKLYDLEKAESRQDEQYQKDFERRFPEIAKYREETQRQKEIQQQEEFKRKFPEIAKYREETQRQKEIAQARIKQEELRNFNIKTQYDIKAIKELQRRLKQGVQNKNELNLEKIRENIIQEDTQQYLRQRVQQREKENKKNQWQMSYIDNLENGYKFEEYIANILKTLGYINVELTSKSGDFGVDVLARKNGINYAFQCKWSSTGHNIGVDAVKEVYSGMNYYKNKKNLIGEICGVVITNSHFTYETIEWAKAVDIMLWNREKLQELLNKAKKRF